MTRSPLWEWSSRSGLIGFISEISFRVFSRDETFQEVTKKVHSGGQLGFLFSTLVHTIFLPFRTRNHFSHTYSWLWQAQASSSQTLSLPLSCLLFLLLIPFLMVPWFSFSLNPKQQGWKGPCPKVSFCSEIFIFFNSNTWEKKPSIWISPFYRCVDICLHGVGIQTPGTLSGTWPFHWYHFRPSVTTHRKANRMMALLFPSILYFIRAHQLCLAWEYLSIKSWQAIYTKRSQPSSC